MKLYLVEANFSDVEFGYQIQFGIFDNYDVAKFQKEKWEKFFKTKKSEFSEKYKDLYSDENEDDEELWSEYFKDKSLFNQILNFDSIIIITKNLNDSNIESNFTDCSLDFQKLIKDYSIEFNRENNLNNILNEPKI
jgi:hypothetical protein